MADKWRIGDLFNTDNYTPPQVSAQTRGEMKYPELNVRQALPAPGGEIGLEGRYLHDKFSPEYGASLTYRRRF